MQILQYIKKEFNTAKTYLFAFAKWLLLALIIGLVCGAVGAFFAKSIDLVTNLRNQNNWLYFLLPLGAVAIVLLYKLLRVENIGTNDIFESIRSKKLVSVLLAPAIFLASVITHLLGGSAGREGAALQLGGSISSFIAKLLRLDEKSRHILTMCGMGALFSAIFGTPLGAFVFALEVVQIGYFCSAAIFPALVSSITAYAVSSLLGVHPERFLVASVPSFDAATLIKVIAIAILGAFVSVVFCKIMHLSEALFKRYFKNTYLRAVIGGTTLIVLTLLVGDFDYNGGGIDVINRIFVSGEVKFEAFILKIIFTAITLASGFKGGEIIPTLFIGATFGGAFGSLIGISPAFSAAIGMSALFCGVTNCPLATLFLTLELFGADGIIYYAIAVAISFVLSGNSGLYKSQKLVFEKLS